MYFPAPFCSPVIHIIPCSEIYCTHDLYVASKGLDCSALKLHGSFVVVIEKNMGAGIIQNYDADTVLKTSCVTLKRLFKLSESWLLPMEKGITIPTHRVVDRIK